MGSLASAFLTEPGPLREQIEAVKRLTDKPFGANLMAMNPMSMAFAEVLIENGIKTVTTSAGSPKELLSILKPAGVKVLHVVPNVETARKAEDAGVDVLIAEGSESGGIQGYMGASTMVLVPLMVDAVKIPVIAAGGIGDSRGYRAAFALGAKGVQVGTRFIASKECIAHQNYKSALCEGRETDTLLIERGKVRGAGDQNVSCRGIGSGRIGYDLQIFPGQPGRGMDRRRPGGQYPAGRSDHRDGARCPVGPGDHRRNGQGLGLSHGKGSFEEDGAGFAIFQAPGHGTSRG